MLPKRLPRYWYDSRRRYFARTGGAARVIAASLAYLGGRQIWQLRCALTRRADGEPPRTTRDILAYSLLPRTGDRRQRPLPGLETTTGLTPGWMHDAKLP
jgi:hypothetical protein